MEKEKRINIYPESIDNITDYGKGIAYKSYDGKEFATIEMAEQYNKLFYEKQLLKNKRNMEEKDDMLSREIKISEEQAKNSKM